MSGFVPYPEPDGPRFPADLVGKQEFRLGEARKGCDASAPFKLQPVQQFVSTYMSPLTPYKSLLLFHGTGIGKTCAAIQAAELQSGAKKRTLVLVPASIQGGFEDNVYNAKRVRNGDVAGASRYQCTGSAYYSRDLEGLSGKALKKTQRARGRRRYEFVGHDKFANTVETVEARARRDFGGLGEEAVEAETTATLRALYDDRLIVVDECHELRSDTGGKPSYARLLQVLRACSGCRLILMSATPMYNRSVEIVDLVNLMMANERRAPLEARKVFGKDDRLTPEGAAALRAALRGRVSAMTWEDPAAFPRTLYPTEAGLAGAAWEPPSRTRDGKEIPRGSRLQREGGEYELYCSRLSEEQARAYANPSLRSAGAMMTAMQLENVCYDGTSAAANEEAFYRAFRKVPGSGGRVLRYAGGTRFLHPSSIDKYAPKIGAATRLIASADGLCFLYSNFRASGVYPAAIALEELGFLPYSGRPMLQDAPALGSPAAPRYVIITKDEESDDGLSVSDKVDAANAGGVRAVLGTETAAQGLDFKAVREVHVLEPWWNMSRIRQVVGRGVRRCSHTALPEEKRNTTVFLHCTTRPGASETLDQRVYREAFNKNLSIRSVERLLAEAAVDCGLYDTRSEGAAAGQVSSQGLPAAPAGRGAAAAPRCDVRWPARRARDDASTVHPYVYKSMADLLAFDVRDALEARRAATFDDLREATGADDLLLSLTLTTLMNPLLAWRWIGDRAVAYRGNLYVLVPQDMAAQPFTLVEAQMGFMFTANPSVRLREA